VTLTHVLFMVALRRAFEKIYILKNTAELTSKLFGYSPDDLLTQQAVEFYDTHPSSIYGFFQDVKKSLKNFLKAPFSSNFTNVNQLTS
jgi:hypothetical protein